MRNGIFALLALAFGGVGYAAVTAGSPSTQPSTDRSCRGMSMGHMDGSMGGNTPTTHPTTPTPALAAPHAACCGG